MSLNQYRISLAVANGLGGGEATDPASLLPKTAFYCLLSKRAAANQIAKPA
jgi:hypothetical protein